ncbi:MAG: FHA domain-containing protein [Actinomycetota bacterium]
MASDPLPPWLTIESVALAAGDGRLVRRATAVLFDPTGENSELTTGFDDALTDEDAVAFAIDALVDAKLKAEPFAIVRWSTDLRLIAFGDISLHTSIPSGPMITGAGSTTWVEHRIDHDRLSDASLIQVSAGTDTEPGTDLRLGIVTCSGFRLNLVLDEESDTANAEAEPAGGTSYADPGSIEVVIEELVVDESTLGLLVFDGMPDASVSGPAIIGRGPTPGDHQATILIDHPEVSRTHAAFEVDGASVWILDQDSRNGTWVRAPFARHPRRLKHDERSLLIDGTVVHLGSVEVSFTWRTPTP